MSFFEFPHTRTYDGDLGWIIKHIDELDDAIKYLNDWITENTPKIDEIIEFFESMNAGDLPPALQESIYKWATINLLPIVAQTLKSVVFGLTDDGHFIATYYDNWEEITFNTTEYDIWTPMQTQFGHLTLSI